MHADTSTTNPNPAPNSKMRGANEAPSCHGGLENLDEEFSYWIDNVEGEVPMDLKGTFFRNGPGRPFAVAAQTVRGK